MKIELGFEVTKSMAERSTKGGVPHTGVVKPEVRKMLLDKALEIEDAFQSRGHAVTCVFVKFWQEWAKLK